ncbi:MAG: FCD domain-containing protein [Propionibacteriaceae bacterium]|jgi:DNA-binding FadR family transcriptional regulator|nr:FCD domain-containing protein [Propionibacteriaceae bacterium]
MEDAERAYQVVLRHIETGILEGQYAPGRQLPSERDLAEQLGVGRPAVREALRVLDAQGVTQSTPGRWGGTRLAPAQGDALARIFSLHLAMSGHGIAELTEPRVALERASASMAATLCEDRTTAELDRILHLMGQTPDPDQFNNLDTDFHVAIARAGDNSLVADLTVAIRQTLRRQILDLERRMESWPAFRATLIEEHRAIRDAIRAGDPAEAATLIEAHIRSAYRQLSSQS